MKYKLIRCNNIFSGLTPIAVALAQQAAPTPYITLVGVTDLTPA